MADMLASTVGKLRVGYADAAILTDCNVTRQQLTLGNPETIMVAKVRAHNHFWATQQPMSVGLWMGQTWWVWDTMKLEEGTVESGAVISARLIGNPKSQIFF